MRLKYSLPSDRPLFFSGRTRRNACIAGLQRYKATIECWWLLVFFDYIMKFRSSAALRMIVRNQPVSQATSGAVLSHEELSHAMDLACVFYFKRVLCLQRSAATAVLLRRHGACAEMVIGAQILPPEFHAWVEIGDAVINDKPYMREIYQILEVC